MIKYLRIKHYKSIEDSGNIEIKPINILIGANGSGKSNFISFFRFLKKIYERELDAFVKQNGGASSIMFYGTKSEYAEGEIQFDNKWQNRYFFRLEPDIQDKLIITKETHHYSHPATKSVFSVEEKPFSNESIIFNRQTDNILHLKHFFNELKIYHFHDTGFTSKMKQPSDVHDNVILYEDGSNLPAILYKIQTEYPQHYEQILNIVKSIAPFFKDFCLYPETNGKIYLRWQECCNEMNFTAHHLSDGTLRMIALATTFFQPHIPAVVIIDEPELGLHPFAIEKLSGLIQYASHRSQIIVSTQSAELISYFQPDDILITEREFDGLHYKTRFYRPDTSELSEWLNNYTLGELWKKNIIRGRP